MTPFSSPKSQVAAQHLSRVAALSLSFWLLKIITTTVGDLSGDLLSITLGLGYLYSLIFSAVVMTVLLVYQFSIKQFQPICYWALILLSATLGAEVSDALGRAFHLGNNVVTLILLIGWGGALMAWFLGVGKIRATEVMNRRDEAFYWVIVIMANSLGSVLGDLLGEQFGIGLTGRMGVSLGILVLLWVLSVSTRFNKAILFWIAFVVSRVWA